MKIYIETPMRVKPKACRYCDYICQDHQGNFECADYGIKISIDAFTECPSWCRLRTETEIAEAKEKEDDR